MAQTRYVVCHGSATRDGEKLSVITIYEPGVPKQQIKEDLPYTKNWGLLSLRDKGSEWLKPMKAR